MNKKETIAAVLVEMPPPPKKVSSVPMSYRDMGIDKDTLEPLPPTCQPGKKAAALSAVRLLDFRLDGDGAPILKHLLGKSHNTAAWLQARVTW